MLQNKEKAMHFLIPAGGTILPLALRKWGDTAVFNHLVSKGAIVHPAQMHHWQLPGSVIPLAVGIPLTLGVIFDLFKDPAHQLMALEFAAPMITMGCFNVFEHFQLQQGYQAPGEPPPSAYPGATQVGRAVHYGMTGRFGTQGGYPRPTYGNR